MQKNLHLYKQPLQTTKKTIKILADNNIFRINFFGGEPLVYPWIVDSIKFSKKAGIATTMVTNALLINKELCKSINKHIDAIGVSLHGEKKMHEYMIGVDNSYGKVMKSLELLEEYNISKGINFTLTKKNIKDLKTLAEKLLKTYKFDFFEINRFITSDKDEIVHTDEFDPTLEDINFALEILSNLKERFPKVLFKMAIYVPPCLLSKTEYYSFISPCGAGQDYCSIHSNGDLRFCSFSKNIIGNIHREKLSDIWKKDIFVKYRRGFWIPQKCKKCDLLSLCMCGCKTTRSEKEYCEDKILSDYPQSWEPIVYNFKKIKSTFKKVNKINNFKINKHAKFYPNENLIVTPSGVKIRVDSSVFAVIEYIHLNKDFAFLKQNIDKIDEIINNLIKIKVVKRRE